MNILNKIEGKLIRLEVIYAHLEATSTKALPIEEGNITSIIMQLHEVLKIMQEVQEIVLEKRSGISPDPFVRHLLDTTKNEIQECIKIYELLPAGMGKHFASEKKEKCACDAIFSSILALQLIIAPS